jgi:hypothetical protein
VFYFFQEPFASFFLFVIMPKKKPRAPPDTEGFAAPYPDHLKTATAAPFFTPAG